MMWVTYPVCTRLDADARVCDLNLRRGKGAERVGNAVSDDGVAEVHARITREGLPIALRGLALVYTLHTIYQCFGPGGIPLLALGAASTALACAFAARWLTRHPPAREHIHFHASATALLVLVNVAVHFALQPHPDNTIHFALFVVAAGAALLEPRSLALTLAATLLTWVALTLTRGDGAIYSPAGLHLLVATVIAVVLRLAHGRTVLTVLRAEARQREAEKLEAIGRLAGGVAHDFNNLLTIIRINARYAMASAERHDDAAARADLRDIVSATDRAARLTQELLAFGRRQMLSPRPIDLGDTLEELKRTVERLVGERVDVHVRREARDRARVDLDPQIFERIVFNLAANARDAMPYGGALTLETRRAELTAGPRPGELAGLAPGTYVTVRVSDTGTGMEPATLARVFEPFFTTKGTRGTGLGLATVYGAVRQSGGAVTVTSTLGRGTCFEIWLPAVGTVSAPAPGPAVEAAAPAHSTA
jgi:signal transduction histidine kinase